MILVIDGKIQNVTGKSLFCTIWVIESKLVYSDVANNLTVNSACTVVVPLSHRL